jgi:Holliday junction resolvasome RuvABC endonuclease subunit
MRVLFIDPGGERQGMAVIEQGAGQPVYLDSWIVKRPRGKLEFQKYKLALEDFWANQTLPLLDYFQPDVVANEIVPAVGGGNFVNPQSEIAKTAVTAIHTICYHFGTEVGQLSARTIQTRITGLNSRKTKITKPKVRNGVVRLFPHLVDRAKEWTRNKEWDESDAIAGGAVYLGYTSESL